MFKMEQPLLVYLTSEHQFIGLSLSVISVKQGDEK
jgi:hypothetical protein